jgi:phosphoribosyl-ATP pyrophosphohydrolase
MFAWMNREALARTVELGEAVYWSRSRKKLWHKGEESGHVQKVLEIRLDCDEDVVLLKIEQAGGIACRPALLLLPEVRRRCAGRRLADGRAGAERSGRNLRPSRPPNRKRPPHEHHTDRLAEIIESRKPAGRRPRHFLHGQAVGQGRRRHPEKIGEEATETVMAAKDVRAGADSGKVLYEVADLWFHTLVLLAQFDLKPQQVLDELARREGVSGWRKKRPARNKPVNRSCCG